MSITKHNDLVTITKHQELAITDLKEVLKDFFFEADATDCIKTLNDFLAIWVDQPDFKSYFHKHISNTVFSHTKIVNFISNIERVHRHILEADEKSLKD